MFKQTNWLSTEEKQLLYLMRVRRNEVKSNFENKYKNNENGLLCNQNVKESECHLLQCTGIVCDPNVDVENVKYLDIYGNLGEQIRAVKTWKRIFKLRSWKLENRSLMNGPQVHRLSASYASGGQQTVDPPPLDSSIAVLLSPVYDSG